MTKIIPNKQHLRNGRLLIPEEDEGAGAEKKQFHLIFKFHHIRISLSSHFSPFKLRTEICFLFPFYLSKGEGYGQTIPFFYPKYAPDGLYLRASGILVNLDIPRPILLTPLALKESIRSVCKNPSPLPLSKSQNPRFHFLGQVFLSLSLSLIFIEITIPSFFSFFFPLSFVLGFFILLSHSRFHHC